MRVGNSQEHHFLAINKINAASQGGRGVGSGVGRKGVLPSTGPKFLKKLSVETESNMP